MSIDDPEVAARIENLADLLGQVGGGLPVGMILLWHGSVASIPTGWQLCDGTNGTPDLRDRFVVGAGGTYSPGATGGSETVTLTTAQLPPHTHNIQGPGSTGTSLASSAAARDADVGVVRATTLTGGGEPHENRPPFYALAYIARVAP